MPNLDLSPLFEAAAFFAVLAIAAVLAVGVSWFGYQNAALWIVGIGIVLGWAAARAVSGACR